MSFERPKDPMIRLVITEIPPSNLSASYTSERP